MIIIGIVIIWGCVNCIAGEMEKKKRAEEEAEKRR